MLKKLQAWLKNWLTIIATTKPANKKSQSTKPLMVW